MKRVCLFIVCGLIVAGAVRGDVESTTLRAGASATSVNPPAGSYIAGDAQNRKFESVHDDIFSKALVLADGEEAIAIVTVDCIGLTSRTIRRMQTAGANAAGLSGLTPERVIVASTHCHSGPDVVGLWGPDYTQSGVNQEYMNELVAKTTKQIKTAAASLRPAVVSAASVESQVDWIENISEPGDIDRTLSVVKIDSVDGKCIATLTNFACHPTILDGVHNVVSSDWIGGHYRQMHENLAGEHLFIQGAVGGWIQPDKGDRSFELADRYGRELATEALTALKKATPVADTTIRFATTTISIPLKNPAWVQLSQAGILPIKLSDVVETTIAAFSIGNIGFATHPGETAPTHSRQTRALLKRDTTVIVGLGLDALGYIVKPEYFTHPKDFRHAGYLTSMSVGPQAGPKMMEGLKTVTEQIQPQ